MKPVFFVSDLHGHKERFENLVSQIKKDEPAALFMGGDIMPHFSRFTDPGDFFEDHFIPLFRKVREDLGMKYPAMFIIMGNDDPRIEEKYLFLGEKEGLWQYIHNRKTFFGKYPVYGYACIPPSPFRLKDWEKYDVSRYVDPGCIPPTEGFRTVESPEDAEFSTIQNDLEALTGSDDLSHAIFLFHSPPYQTKLDRASLDGMFIDHVPLDVHIGSIAIRRFIEERKPMITLHGHVHESSGITGSWAEKMGDTWAFNAAVDQRPLSLIRLKLDDPAGAERMII